MAVEHLQRSVGAQATAPDSTLHFYRKMIGFRHAWDALSKGGLSDLKAEGSVVSFQRSHGDQRLFCAFNLGGAPAPVTLPDGAWRQDKGAPFAALPDAGNGQVTLPPWQAYFAAAETA